MDSSQRGALMLVRLVGVALILAGVMQIGLYLVKRLLPQPPLPVEILPCVMNAIPSVLGIVVLVAAKPLAEWISNKLDE
jgi:hypothetical protein